MALKTSKDINSEQEPLSAGGEKAKKIFSASASEDRVSKDKKEKKRLTTFSIEDSFKAELEDMFSDMGLCWAAGIRFALKEFMNKRNG